MGEEKENYPRQEQSQADNSLDGGSALLEGREWQEFSSHNILEFLQIPHHHHHPLSAEMQESGL